MPPGSRPVDRPGCQIKMRRPGRRSLPEPARARRESPRFAETRLIAVTGYGQEGDIARSRSAGFDEHLVKPVDPDRLLNTLRPEG
jgi:CheY-like chemotaxis protein